MKNFICLYSIELSFEEQLRTENGLIYADDFRDAIEQLEGEIYGTDLMKINSMELFDSPVAIFSPEVFALMQKEIEQGV